MKTLIVYYSLEGNTAYAADLIAEKLNADKLEIKPVRSYPTKGFRKFFWGGKSAVMAEKPKLQPYVFEAEKYDRIILGFPIWASTFAPPIRTFVSKNDLSAKQIAVFACQGGSGAEKAFEKLKTCLNISDFDAELILIDPKARPSEQNEIALNEFCQKLKQE